jgi:hypothetical protein
MCLSQARSLISNVTCRGLIVFSDLRSEVIVRFVDICVIVDHQFNNFPVWLSTELQKWGPCRSKVWHVKNIMIVNRIYLVYPIISSNLYFLCFLCFVCLYSLFHLNYNSSLVIFLYLPVSISKREKHKLILMYKIINGHTPNYLS